MATLQAFALLALAPFAAAQSQVWTVGGQSPDFTSLQAAVDAAADGDTLLVRNGTYGAFLLDGKGLSIVADTQAFVTVSGLTEIANVPAGRSVHLVRLQLRGLGPLVPNTPALFAHDCAGSLRLWGCSLWGGDGKNGSGPTSGAEGGRLSRCDDVALCLTTVLGGTGGGAWGGMPGGNGLFVRDSPLALYDCTIRGGLGGDDVFDHAANGGPGGNGYESPDAEMFASGTSFQGGAGGNGGEEQTDPFGGGCVHAGYGGNGGHGIFLGSQPPGTALPTADLQSCGVTGGAGGFGGPGYMCPSGPSGQPGQPILIANGIATPSSTPARKMTAPNPVREATSVALSFTGVNGDRVWLLQSLFPEHSTNTPFEGCQLVKSGFLTRGSMKGVIGASGQLAATLQLANLPIGVETSVLHLQMLVFDANGAGVLGTAVPLVIVDSQF